MWRWAVYMQVVATLPHFYLPQVLPQDLENPWNSAIYPFHVHQLDQGIPIFGVPTMECPDRPRSHVSAAHLYVRHSISRHILKRMRFRLPGTGPLVLDRNWMAQVRMSWPGGTSNFWHFLGWVWTRCVSRSMWRVHPEGKRNGRRVQHMMRSCRVAAVTHRSVQDDWCLSCFFILVSCRKAPGLSMPFPISFVPQWVKPQGQLIFDVVNWPGNVYNGMEVFLSPKSTVFYRDYRFFFKIPFWDGLHKRISVLQATSACTADNVWGVQRSCAI